jgi:hypothetical protein
MPIQDPVSIIENFLDVSYPVSPIVSEAWKTVKELAQRFDNSRYATAQQVWVEYKEFIAKNEFEGDFTHWCKLRLNS